MSPGSAVAFCTPRVSATAALLRTPVGTEGTGTHPALREPHSEEKRLNVKQTSEPTNKHMTGLLEKRMKILGKEELLLTVTPSCSLRGLPTPG